MATSKPADPTHCHGCGIRLPTYTRCHGCGIRLPTYTRITLPRAQTGDLAFCGYRCLTSWEERR